MSAYPMYKGGLFAIGHEELLPMFQITAIERLSEREWCLSGNDPGVTVNPHQMSRVPMIGDWWYRNFQGKDDVMDDKARRFLISINMLSAEPVENPVKGSTIV